MRFQQFMNKSHLMGLYQEYHDFFTPLNRELKNHGTNLHDSLILLALFFETQKGVSPGDLETTLKIPKDQVSKSLKVLEAQGLIKRNISKNDKRKRELIITNEGKKKASSLIKTFDQKEKSYEEKIEQKASPNGL